MNLDNQSAVITRKWGGRTGAWQGGREVLNVETEPTSSVELYQRTASFAAVRWAVIVPSSVTSFEVTRGRWVSGPEGVSSFVTERVDSYSKSVTFHQAAERDPLHVFVSAIAGPSLPMAADAGIRIVWRGIDNPADI